MTDRFAASNGIQAFATHLTKGLALERLVQNITQGAQALDNNPLAHAQAAYYAKRNSGLANYAGVWRAVRHDNKSIDPVYTLDKLFAVANDTHRLIQIRLDTRFTHLMKNDEYNPKAFPTKKAHEEWYKACLANLTELRDLAVDAATWAAIKATSKGDRWAEHKANVKIYTALAHLGYKDPHTLPKELEVVADTAINLYKSYEKHQLSLY